jgi:RND family efflux transporter MFP subunit
MQNNAYVYSLMMSRKEPVVKHLLAALVIGLLPVVAHAQTQDVLQSVDMTDWKAVYGRIEARLRAPARARIGGVLVELSVTEGDLVQAGQPLARIMDEKITFQLKAIDAQIQALQSQMENAETELKRGEDLLTRGVTTVQRLDALRTQVDVLSGQINAAEANRRVIEQQAADGVVLAPTSGRVLDVPVTQGAVLMPGEAIAVVGGGGFFLRLAIPERHATALKTGATIAIDGLGGTGVLARIYPQIENGRVIADVDVPNLSDAFVDARVLVRIPVGNRQTLSVPETALITRSGLDFVAVEQNGTVNLRTVVPGQHQDGRVEILSGLQSGDIVMSDSVEAGHE